MHELHHEAYWTTIQFAGFGQNRPPNLEGTRQGGVSTSSNKCRQDGGGVLNGNNLAKETLNYISFGYGVCIDTFIGLPGVGRARHAGFSPSS
jgi:hypothetical protein